MHFSAITLFVLYHKKRPVTVLTGSSGRQVKQTSGKVGKEGKVVFHPAKIRTPLHPYSNSDPSLRKRMQEHGAPTLNKYRTAFLSPANKLNIRETQPDLQKTWTVLFLFFRPSNPVMMEE